MKSLLLITTLLAACCFAALPDSASKDLTHSPAPEIQLLPHEAAGWDAPAAVLLSLSVDAAPLKGVATAPELVPSEMENLVFNATQCNACHVREPAPSELLPDFTILRQYDRSSTVSLLSFQAGSLYPFWSFQPAGIGLI